MNKTILNYGLLSGAVGAVLMFCSALYFNYTSNYNGGEIIGYTGILLSMLFVFFGVRAYRRREADGNFGFGKAFQLGIIITLISCLCYVIAWMLVYQFVMPDFMDKHINQSLAQMRATGMDEAQIQQKSAEMEQFKEMYKNPLIRATITFLQPLPIGLMTTLISALMLRKR